MYFGGVFSKGILSEVRVPGQNYHLSLSCPLWTDGPPSFSGTSVDPSRLSMKGSGRDPSTRRRLGTFLGHFRSSDTQFRPWAKGRPEVGGSWCGYFVCFIGSLWWVVVGSECPSGVFSITWV